LRTGAPGAEPGFGADDAFHLPRLPERIVIAGGGYIAVEFAGIFNGLGARVTQLYRGEQILRGFDDGFEHVSVHIRVADDALRRLAAPCPELRLDQDQALPPGVRQAQPRGPGRRSSR